MSRKVNIMLQSLMLICQLLNQFFDAFTPRGKTVALVIMLTLQGIIGIIASNYNPDGKSAVFPYVPPKALGKVWPPIKRALP